MKSELECMKYLAMSNDVGISSRCIVMRACGLAVQDAAFGYPHDTDDLGRCMRAIKALEIDITCMRGFNRVWDKMVDRWQEITAFQHNYHAFRGVLEEIEKSVFKSRSMRYSNEALYPSNAQADRAAEPLRSSDLLDSSNTARE